VYDDSELGQILERIQGARAVVTKELQVPAEMISQFPDSVELICEAGTGYNNIAIDAAVKKGITVCNVPAYSSHRVAHTAVMMMLNLSSTMQMQIKMLGKGDRSNFTEHLQVPHVELNGKTLGVVGYGNIGRQVIKVAQALDMKVLCYTRTPRPDQENLSFVPLETLLKESDYVSLHCPLNDKTRHIINEETLALMKPSAFLINTSRGALIDEPSLISALQAGKIAGAGLDVQETEPPAADNPLYTLDNVIITPHMGWKGLETRQRLVGVVADDIRGFFEGKPVNVVS
jgi:glycerate dehydrogenase